jgi:ABC-type multidrug transport system fused ATPase/permease subunit
MIDGKILLIDEATTHVDTNTDEIIQQILCKKFINQTIIIIPHCLNTVMDSDKIVVGNDGIIVEYGTPTELITKQNQLLADINNDNQLSLILK